jgi:hypothetical protein
VPVRWRVGRATFLPAGRLLAMIERDRARLGGQGWTIDYFQRNLGESDHVTVSVPAWTRYAGTNRGISDGAFEEARDDARDSIALLRLFQRTRTTWSTERQTFGLAIDIGGAREDNWISDRAGRILSAGSRRHGSLGAWGFARGDVAAFSADRRFTYIDEALRVPDDERTDWQHRAIMAVRTMGTAVPSDRPATRIVLAATAIEALVGDAFQYGAAATGGHQLARRAIFPWCGLEFDDPHGQPPGRAACPFLLATSASDLRRRVTAAKVDDHRPRCSYYESMQAISDDRNAAVHGADTLFNDADARRAEHEVEAVILAVVGWVVDRGATTLVEYLQAIDALPAEGSIGMPSDPLPPSP